MCQGPKLDEWLTDIPPDGSSSDQPKPGGSDGMASAKQEGKRQLMDWCFGVPGPLSHLDGMASAKRQGKRQPMVESDPNCDSDLCADACIIVDWDALGIDFEEVLSVLNKHGYDARKATMKAIIDAWKSCPEPFIWILRQARSHHLRLKSYIIEQRNGDPSWYLQLPPYIAAMDGHWEIAKSILDHGEDALRAETALHVAVSSGPKNIIFIRKLLERLTEADLEAKNINGCTPLDIAARVGNVEAAKVVVEKHSRLLSIPSSNDSFPIHTAFQVNMALPNCPTCLRCWLNSGRNMYGIEFLIRGQHIPEAHPTAFSETSSSQYHESLIDISPVNMCQGPKLVESCHIDIPPEGSSSAQPNPGGSDGMASAKWLTNKREAASRSLLSYLLTKKGKHPDPKGSGQKLPDDAFALIEPALTIRAFNAIAKYASALTRGLQVKKPLIRAEENDIQEMVKEITDAFPNVDWRDNGDSLRVAIQNHQWELYMQLPDSYVDKGMQSVEEATKDNILHVSGHFPASDRHRIASCAVLQMQEALYWFKEIESLVPPSYINKRNKDGKTPQEVLTENHKNLMVEAEKRVKETGNPCIVVAGAILALSFAASITVPGGLHADNGRPVLGSEIIFKIFGGANALSFIGACVSMLTFLPILSSRYTEGDFLLALPMKLVVGILSLYMAVASMMVSYTLIQYLNFGPIDEKRWEIIGCAVVVPCFLSVGAMFALGHFSLVAEIIKMTYLSGTLEKRRRSSSFLQKVWTRMRSIAGLWKREGEATIPIFVRK